MSVRIFYRVFFTILTAAFMGSFFCAAQEEVVLSDRFDELPIGVLLGDVGAEAEYHYLRATAPIAGWGVSTFRSGGDWTRSWRGVIEDGKRMVAQTMSGNRLLDTHPMFVAGDVLWKDYTVKVRVKPEELVSDKYNNLCGVAFRYVTCRSCYVFGLGEKRAFIKRIRNGSAFRVPDEKVLAEKAFEYEAGKYLDLEIKVVGDRISASVDGEPFLEATDSTFPKGRIALVSDVPAKFASVTVTMTSRARTEYLAERKKIDDEEAALQAKNPKPVLWKTIKTNNFGVGRNLRFGDLTGNGKLDIAVGQVHHYGPKDSNAEISCITAVDTDGKILWQYGHADSWKGHLTNDVAFQIHDLDGDGKNEVIFCKDRKIIVLDGATGEEKMSAPTPEFPKPATPPKNPPSQNKWFSQILGDCLYFCDVRGSGRKGDIILKDRYKSFWVYDDKLNLLWSASCNTGHYPHAVDIDGDGKDEIMMGYTLFAPDGKVLWTLDDKLKDHADGVAIVKMNADDKEYSIFVVASDEGVLLLDTKGNILKHHQLGHVQNPGIADFRPDMPGLEVVTVNFWGNQGIIHFIDSKGDVYHEMEPFQHGSVCLPVNWTGKPGEFVMLSPNYDDGGLIDGWGRRVVRMPADGAPDMCYHAADFTGDCRDEIVVWDPFEIRIYTQDDNPLSGDLYRPKKSDLSNDSNYRSYISLPPNWGKR